METGDPSNYKNHDLLQIQAKNPSKQSKEPLKVRYISSPVKVSAKNAAEFKAIVQELTGKDSRDDDHHPTNPAAEAGGAANAWGLDRRPGDHDGERNANPGYELDYQSSAHRSNPIVTDEVEDDGFWKLPENLSTYGFPFG